MMIKISALNESSDTSNEEGPLISTREAQEEEAFCLYEQALKALNSKNYEEAEKSFKKLLETSLLQEAPEPEGQQPLPPSLNLKYLAFKNLASIFLTKNDTIQAIKYLLEAVDIDGTDTTMWIKLGNLAVQVVDYRLARQAYQEGVKCNPNNWICLDKLITMLYVIGDYSTCLCYIAQALEKDYYYLRGLVLRDQIYEEHPSIREITDPFFDNCDPKAHTTTYNQEDANEIIEECARLREKKEPLVPEPLKPVTFQQPLKEYKWKDLGECLVGLIEALTNSEPHISVFSPVNLSMYTGDSPEDHKIVFIPTAMETEPSAAIDSPDHCPDSDPSEMVMEGLESGEIIYEEGRRGSKRRRLLFDIGESAKRRSSRVRNPLATTVKKVDFNNYLELLQRFLPISLQRNKKKEKMERRASREAKALVEEKESETKQNPLLSAMEEKDVKEFLAEHQKNCGVTYVMLDYLTALSSKLEYLWPEDLGEVYSKVYEKFRPRIQIPDPLSDDYENEEFKRYALIILMYQEFQIAKWQQATQTSLSPNKMSLLGPNFPRDSFWADLDYLLLLVIRRDIFGEFWPSFAARALWIEARFHTLENHIDFALNTYKKLLNALYVIEEDTDCPTPVKITLINSPVHNVISPSIVQNQMDSLQRFQSLEEVQRLFDIGDYQRVVELLILTFQEPSAPKQKQRDANVPERHAQLLLLQDALWKLENYKDCLVWCEVAFSEALQEFLAADTSSPAFADWSITIHHLIESLNKCMQHDMNLLAHVNLSRFAHNLIQYIANLFQSEDPSPPNLLPWVMLYYIIHYQEDKDESYPQIRLPDLDLPSTMAPSQMYLFASHEYLGRHAWCTASDGLLLQLSVDTMLSELQNINPHPFREDLESGLEQCFYCLYQHPNKRTKAKHLAEHMAPQIHLTWERAAQLFECFKPSILPEFDGYRSSTISAETENLFKRIIQLIPPEEDPSPRTEALISYIEGNTNTAPEPPSGIPGLIARDIYYLLADFHFKNKDFRKAIKYYILDICVTSDRIDSWAGMALSRSSQLEAKLNSPELKAEPQLFKKATCALRCFKHALTIDSSSTALWIEYGSMAYLLHSHSSRFLKQQDQFKYSEEMVQLLETKAKEMLTQAKTCFLSANRCGERGAEANEVWLHHYMLGKIAEKSATSPIIYLNHYKKALFHLHKDGARFPKKILYHSPAELAVESLEVYYRIHAATLKYIFKHEVDGISQDETNAIGQLLKDIASGNFAMCQDIKDADRFQSQSSSEESSGGVSISTKRKRSTCAADHSYLDTAMPATEVESSSSSAETEDAAIIKELVQSLVMAVSEDMKEMPAASATTRASTATTVIGDTKLKKIEDAALLATKQKTIEDLLKDNCSIKDIVKMCTAALRECTSRYPQNYKAPYRLAHYFFRSKCDKNVKWAHDILLSINSVPPNNPYHPNAGLFSERKNTNFFNAIWRVPSNDIDRPAGFASHMYRAVVLVLEILTYMQNHSMLISLGLQLSRVPELGKRYLREADRNLLYKDAFDRGFKIFRDKMNDLLAEEPPPAESRLISFLVEIFRTWHNLHKAGTYTDEANELLESAYTMYKLGEVDPSPAVLDQAISFCQLHSTKQLAAEEAANEETAKGKKSSS